MRGSEDRREPYRTANVDIGLGDMARLPSRIGVAAERTAPQANPVSGLEIDLAAGPGLRGASGRATVLDVDAAGDSVVLLVKESLASGGG